jgi:hypothetical protein
LVRCVTPPTISSPCMLTGARSQWPTQATASAPFACAPMQSQTGPVHTRSASTGTCRNE